MKSVNEWTRKELEALKLRDWNEDIGTFDSLVILPTKRLHDSGYRAMDFVAVRKGQPVCRLSGCSDVLHIDGIGGMGERYGTDPAKYKAWSVDCLKKSGLLHVFCSSCDLKAGSALSSFEVFAVKRK